jgi:antitoxin VapB
MIDNSSSRV